MIIYIKYYKIMGSKISYRLLNLSAEIKVPKNFKLTVLREGFLYNLISPNIRDEITKGTCLISYYDISQKKGKINLKDIEGKIIKINHGITYEEGNYNQFNVIRKTNSVIDQSDIIDLYFILHYNDVIDAFEGNQIIHKTSLITHINGITKTIDIPMKRWSQYRINEVYYNEGNIYILENDMLYIVDIENESINNFKINAFISKPSLKYDNGLNIISEKIYDTSNTSLNKNIKQIIKRRNKRELDKKELKSLLQYQTVFFKNDDPYILNINNDSWVGPDNNIKSENELAKEVSFLQSKKDSIEGITDVEKLSDEINEKTLEFNDIKNKINNKLFNTCDECEKLLQDLFIVGKFLEKSKDIVSGFNKIKDEEYDKKKSLLEKLQQKENYFVSRLENISVGVWKLNICDNNTFIIARSRWKNSLFHPSGITAHLWYKDTNNEIKGENLIFSNNGTIEPIELDPETINYYNEKVYCLLDFSRDYTSPRIFIYE